jgi:hypothetical protein
LRGVGAHSTEALLVAGARFFPEAIEHRSALPVQSLHRQQGKIAVFGIDPGARRKRSDQDRHHDQRGHEAASHASSKQGTTRATRAVIVNRNMGSPQHDGRREYGIGLPAETITRRR